MSFRIKFLLLGVVVLPAAVKAADIRVATFNVSLNRRAAGDLASQDSQAVKAATILRTVRPDIVLLNEIDFDDDGEAIRLFQETYLQSSDLPGDTEPLKLEYVWASSVNTGVPSGKDLDNDGRTGGPTDSYGFGWFPGQLWIWLVSRTVWNGSVVSVSDSQ